MTNRYRLHRRKRSGVYYAHNSGTGKQESLKTKDKATAQQLLAARNAAHRQPLLNLALARTYIAAHDVEMITRPWRRVMDQFCSHGRDSTRERSERAFGGRQFDCIRDKPVMETTADDFLQVMVNGESSVAHYLRRLHNLALNLGWLPWPVLNNAAWPKVQHGSKRAVTHGEYEQIITAEQNVERRHYYQLLWETGAAQSDAATLNSDNINWEDMVLVYQRKELRTDSEPCFLRIGPTLAKLLGLLPASGNLFPGICHAKSKDRSAEISPALSRAWNQRDYAAQFPVFLGGTSICQRLSRAFCSGRPRPCQ